MKRMIIFLWLLTAIFCFFSSAIQLHAINAENKVADNIDEDSLISVASEPGDIDSGKLVDEMIKEYLERGKGKQIREKIKREGGWYGYDIEYVTVGPENPNWAKHRLIAFEKALNKVENQYLMFQHQSIKSEKISEIFKSISENVPDYQPKDTDDPHKMKIIIDKLLAVAEGKIDNVLDQMGIDKDQFQKAPKPQKHTMIAKSLRKSTFVESIGSLSGFLPIQTFEGHNAQKEHAIGVLCIATPNLRQFAHDVLHNRDNIEVSKTTGVDLYELYSKDSKALIHQFGVRKMKDQLGYPVLVSFGQWANSKKAGNRRIRQEYHNIAKKQAALIAKNQLALFLAGKSMYQSNSEIGELFEVAYRVHPDNYKEEEIAAEILDSLREKSRATARISLSGLNQIYSWTENHPMYGHEIVGIILTWSPVSEKHAREIRDWKAQPSKNSAPKDIAENPNPKRNGKTGVNMGRDDMKLDDF